MKQKEKIVGNLLYGQSGGPTSVINSTAYGVIKEARKHKDVIKKCYIMKNGITGLINDILIDMEDYTDSDLAKLKVTPGAAFGSTRTMLPTYEEDIKIYEKIEETFKKYNIRYFFYNGGNDSMDTINKICDYFKTRKYELHAIGIPKTIDNDLLFMDHTPGYASAIKFIANVMIEVYLDDMSYKKGRVNIVEIMGRNAGWLTAGSILAKTKGCAPDLIYVPEVPFNKEKFLEDVKKCYEAKNRCIIAVSEGIKDEQSVEIGANSGVKDAFGHAQLGGAGLTLCELIHNNLGYKTRNIELSLLQRANSMLASEVDVKEAIDCGRYAVKKALQGYTHKVVTIKRINDNPYKSKMDVTDINLVANKEKLLPLTYIKNGNYIDDSFIDYAYPLINGKKGDGLLDVFMLKEDK